MDERTYEEIHAKAKCGCQCDCGSRETYYTGYGGYQDADASRNMPMIEGDEVYCHKCGAMFWY